MPRKIGFSRAAPRPRPRRRPAETKAERDRFYHSKAWRGTRAEFLQSNPLCVDCLAEGNHRKAIIPHHVQERLDAPDLALDHANLEALCNRHHTIRHKRPGRRPPA